MRTTKSSKKSAPPKTPALVKQTIRFRNPEHYALVVEAAALEDVSINVFMKTASLRRAQAVLSGRATAPSPLDVSRSA